MKKVFLFMLVLCFSAVSANAQAFAKGDKVLGLNIGLGGGYGIPVSLSYEQGIYELNKDMSIGVGGIIGYGGSSENISIGKWKYSNFLLGARGAWHYTGVKNLDLYAGLTLGYNVGSAKFTWKDKEIEKYNKEPESSAGGFLWGITAGARYYFTPSFGVNAELGYGLSYFSIGINYKL